MTATVQSGIRYVRRKSRRKSRIRWKAATVRWCVIGVVAFFAVNWVYQMIRKPVEILAPISDSWSKSPVATWQSYGALFEEHSTNIISAEFLAALAQLESDGNPIARTYWRWQWSWSPFEIYRPASSAVGMFQITDGTFVEGRKYCIRDHTVASAGPWDDFNSCWFNELYTRILPSHSIEMTSAYLHQKVSELLPEQSAKASLEKKQKLAAVIHLCGAKRGQDFAARGFRTKAGELCGTHDLQRYLQKIDLLKKRFARLAAS
jgi:hypothetical protein